MRITKILFILALTVFCASSAHAALVFSTDFAQDGRYDVTWPMKTGEVVTVDVYVSNVPAPGLISMGFKLTYNPAQLVVESAAVDIVNWPQGPSVNEPQAGEVIFVGFRLAGMDGNNISLAKVTFRCVSEGTSELTLLRISDTYAGFVLDSEPAVVCKN